MSIVPIESFEKVRQVVAYLKIGDVVPFYDEDTEEVRECEITGDGFGNNVQVSYEVNGIVFIKTIDALDIIPEECMDIEVEGIDE